MSYKQDKGNPFGGPSGNSTTEWDAAIYGRVDVPASGRVVAKPVAIDEIWADMRQPRRVFPIQVRGEWRGDPAGVAQMFEKWQRLINQLLRTGERLDIAAVVRGTDFVDVRMDREDDERREKLPAPVMAMIELIDLAESIRDDGLINSITVYEAFGRLNIETGERRWAAHHLLYLYTGDEQWSKITAQRVPYSVLRQIKENTSRRDLNAISLVRSYALACMEIASRNGAEFEPIEAMQVKTPHGYSDRPFYAQIEKTPYGSSNEVLETLNLTNRSMLSHYQKILKMDDHSWVLADMNDWGYRECLATVKPPKPREERIVDRGQQLPSGRDPEAGVRGGSDLPPRPAAPPQASGSSSFPDLPEWDDERLPEPKNSQHIPNERPALLDDEPVEIGGGAMRVIQDARARGLLNLLIAQVDDPAEKRLLAWLEELTDEESFDSDPDSLYEELDMAFDVFARRMDGLFASVSAAVEAVREMVSGA